MNTLAHVLRAAVCISFGLLIGLVHAPHSAAAAASSGLAEPGLTICGYLDVVQNLADLKDRVSRWEQGDAQSRAIALEKVERLEIMLDLTPWPSADLVSTASTLQAAIAPVRLALETENLQAAKSGLAQSSDHELTHAFYDWLSPLQGLSSPSATLSAYQDVVRNLGDLKARVAMWERGDNVSQGVALEKAERLIIVLESVSWPTAEASAQALALKGTADGVRRALVAEDLDASRSLVSQASDHAFTHSIYDGWIALSAPVGGPDVTMAVFHDIVRNVADLKARVGLWESGDSVSYGVALEKAERLEALTHFLQWPASMTEEAMTLAAAVGTAHAAITAEDLQGAKAAAAMISDHDLTHRCYEYMVAAQ
jgi:hypothetical protein